MTAATKELHRLLKQQKRELREQRLAELEEAQRMGDAATAWRLSYLLAERGRGSRRRQYSKARELSTYEERATQMQAAGKEGGYSAVILTEPYEQVIRPEPPLPSRD